MASRGEKYDAQAAGDESTTVRHRQAP